MSTEDVISVRKGTKWDKKFKKKDFLRGCDPIGDKRRAFLIGLNNAQSNPFFTLAITLLCPSIGLCHRGRGDKKDSMILHLCSTQDHSGEEIILFFFFFSIWSIITSIHFLSIFQPSKSQLSLGFSYLYNLHAADVHTWARQQRRSF